jgi:hypothetical protein
MTLLKLLLFVETWNEQLLGWHRSHQVTCLASQILATIKMARLRDPVSTVHCNLGHASNSQVLHSRPALQSIAVMTWLKRSLECTVQRLYKLKKCNGCR